VTRYLVLFILFAILYHLLRSVIRGLFVPSGRRTKPREESLPSEELVQDPFCLTYVPIRSALRKKVDGRELFFCSPECAKRFIARERS
jgi:uncharacterized protein